MKIETKSILSQGIAASWPICLGYLPIGLAFGVLAQKAGLHSVEIALMSIFVFAGSAQFIAVSMLSGHAAMISIIMTTFMVNLRHLLMSSALAVYLGPSGKKLSALFAYGVTDESFAINLAKFVEGRWDLKRALVLNHSANISWIGSTMIGGYAGQFIPAYAFGIDYALIAMFICLLIFQLRGLKYMFVAAVSGGLAVLLSLLLPGNTYIVLASALGAFFGLALNRSKRYIPMSWRRHRRNNRNNSNAS